MIINNINGVINLENIGDYLSNVVLMKYSEVKLGMLNNDNDSESKKLIYFNPQD